MLFICPFQGPMTPKNPIFWQFLPITPAKNVKQLNKSGRKPFAGNHFPKDVFQESDPNADD